jgi:large subunit ribosomal protein L35Ae
MAPKSSSAMEATIVNFRQGRHHVTPNQMILTVSGVENKEAAEKLVGKTVTWESPAKKQIKGKITAAHGNKGAVRVLFEKGMPGQSFGNKVKIE